VRKIILPILGAKVIYFPENEKLFDLYYIEKIGHKKSLIK